MLLFATVNSQTPAITPPDGWRQVGEVDSSVIHSIVWERVAGESDPGSQVTVALSSYARIDLRLVAYSGTDSKAPIIELASKADYESSDTRTTPSLDVSRDGSWIVSYWADKSSDTTTWTAPDGAEERSSSVGTGGGSISALVADAGSAAGAGLHEGVAATLDVPGGKGVMWTLSIASGLPDGIGFRATAGFNDNTQQAQLTVPVGAQRGDGMALLLTVNSSETEITPPAGWRQVAESSDDGLRSLVWQRVVNEGDPGSRVTVTLSGYAKVDLRLLVYQGTNAFSPVYAKKGGVDLTEASERTTPQVEVEHAGSHAISYWADKSATTTEWALPNSVSQRGLGVGDGQAHITAVVADSGGPVEPGSYGGLTATSNAASSKAVVWTLSLLPWTSGGACAYPTITGTSGGDTITGTAAPDVIAGGGGNDTIDGGDGADTICGEEGDDQIDGQGGPDRILGGKGNDPLVGGPGEDYLHGGEGANDNCTRGETWTGCEYPNNTRESIEGPRGSEIVLDGGEPIKPWNVRIGTTYAATKIAASKQVGPSYRVDLAAGTTFQRAKVTVPYMQGALGDTPAEDVRIYRLDSELGVWLPAGINQSVDTVNRTVTTTVEASAFDIAEASATRMTFGVFPASNAGQLFESYWPAKPVWCVPAGDDAPRMDVSFVVDTSGSMGTNDPDGMRVEAAKQFVDAMKPADRAAVVGFASSATTHQNLTLLDTDANVAAVKEALEQTRPAAGGTDITAGVRAGTATLEDGGPGRPRVAILLTDGQSAYDQAATEEAKQANVTYYTFGLGPDVDGAVLEQIASETGGTFQALSDSGQLPGLYQELSETLIDSGEDSDSDGVTDCIEKHGALTASGIYGKDNPRFNGDRYIRTDPNDPDTDGDQLTDGAELGSPIGLRSSDELARNYRFLRDAGITRYWNPSSDPRDADTDGEALLDNEEVDYRTNSFLPDTDGDGANDYDEVQLGGELDPIVDDALFETGEPANLDGLSPLTLIRPIQNRYNWLYNELVWDAETGDCTAGGCPILEAWAQQQFDDDSEYKKLICGFFSSCNGADLRREWIEKGVENQGLFTMEGYFTPSYVVDRWVVVCQKRALAPRECYKDEKIDEVASQDVYAQNLEQVLLEILTMLPGGTRHPDPEIDQARTKVQELARRACAETPRLPGQSPTRWGTEVHKLFNRLIEESGYVGLFGETGYLDSQVVGKNGNAWGPRVTAPDAVFGQDQYHPRAFFDLKTGAKGIQPKWLRELLANIKELDPKGVPVFEIRC